MKLTGREFFIVFIFVFTFCFSSAQSNYRSAKILKLNGDTIDGSVNDKEWSKSPVSIWFKGANESKERAYFAYQLHALIIDSSDYYVSAAVHVDRNYSTASDIMKVYSQDSTSKETVFLRVLIKSRLSLYLFVDENNKEHYYMKNDTGDYQELISKKVPITIAEGNGNFKTNVYRNSTYLNQLRSAMMDWPALTILIDGVSYNEKDLLKLFRDYNRRLKGNSIQYMAPLKTLHAEWYIMGGLDMTKLSFDGINNFSESYEPFVGIRGLFPLSRNREKSSMLLEFALKNYDTKSSFYDDPYNAGYPAFNEYELHFKMLYARVNVAYQYKYVTRGAEPYFNLGFSGGYILNYSSEESVIYVVNNTYSSPVNEGPVYNDPEDFGFGYFGSLGVRVKRFSAEVRYERSEGFTSGLASSVNSAYFLLAYKISKY